MLKNFYHRLVVLSVGATALLLNGSTIGGATQPTTHSTTYFGVELSSDSIKEEQLSVEEEAKLLKSILTIGTRTSHKLSAEISTTRKVIQKSIAKAKSDPEKALEALQKLFTSLQRKEEAISQPQSNSTKVAATASVRSLDEGKKKVGQAKSVIGQLVDDSQRKLVKEESFQEVGQRLASLDNLSQEFLRDVLLELNEAIELLKQAITGEKSSKEEVLQALQELNKQLREQEKEAVIAKNKLDPNRKENRPLFSISFSSSNSSFRYS